MRESVMVFKSASLRDNWNRSVRKSAFLLMAIRSDANRMLLKC